MFKKQLVHSVFKTQHYNVWLVSETKQNMSNIFVIVFNNLS